MSYRPCCGNRASYSAKSALLATIVPPDEVNIALPHSPLKVGSQKKVPRPTPLGMFFMIGLACVLSGLYSATMNCRSGNAAATVVTVFYQTDGCP
jgi:hypothetical protein